MKRTLFLLLAAVPLLALERDPARYERYLIPVYAPQSLPGAYGAQWRTSLYLRNDGDTPVDAFPLTPDCLSSIGCFQFLMRQYPALPAQTTAFHAFPFPPHPVGVVNAGAAGAFFYVERDGAGQLSMRLAVGDVSRTPAGSTEIPIVSESEFFAAPRSILGVPLSPATRVALRVYTADPRPDASIVVSVHEMPPRVIPEPPFRDLPGRLAQRTFTFAYDESQDKCGRVECDESLRYLPGIVQIHNLLDVFPELAALPPQEHGLRIEIAPATPGLRYWPLVTATRDVDGFVSVFTVR